MNSTTPPPAIIDGDVAVGYVLVPFLLITIIGIAAAVVGDLSCISVRKGESTDFGISCYRFTHMIPQRNSMKLNKKCCGEKRTQGLYKDGPEIINSDALFCPKTTMHDGRKPWHRTFSVWRQPSAISEVMHKTISLLFCLSLLPFAVIFEHISDRQRLSFSCFMYMIVCVVLMPILCA